MDHLCVDLLKVITYINKKIKQPSIHLQEFFYSVQDAGGILGATGTHTR